jgi:uncharacterized OsmC-like protein/alpha/beta superfamily hydrolase
MTKTVDVTFTGSGGQALAGELDLPEGRVRAYALLAHCFTGSQDSPAAHRISQGLQEEGIAVLRFDVTGLGESGGNSADAAPGAEDLLAAVDFLRTHHWAPSLLIGHSLGGAAALAAAGRMPELDAVVTVGAPADPARRRRIAELRCPLLILHSPIDNTVGIGNAGRIFAAARHPKSFVSLDGSDHLLTGKGQAARAAALIAAWAAPYLDKEDDGGTPAAGGMSPAAEAAAAPASDAAEPEAGGTLEPGLVTVVENGRGKYGQTIRAGRHTWFADEPLSLPGAADSGPTPYDLLLAGLGACTSMTMRMYADRKGIPLDNVTVGLRQERIHAADCEACEGRDGHITLISRDIAIEGNVTAEQRAGLLRIADKCPVHRTLHGDMEIVTKDVSAPGR